VGWRPGRIGVSEVAPDGPPHRPVTGPGEAAD
jgi:hypothetical protein